MVIPVADNHVGAKTINEVQEKVVQLKNRVADRVSACHRECCKKSLANKSNDVMDEFEELKY